MDGSVVASDAASQDTSHAAAAFPRGFGDAIVRDATCRFSATCGRGLTRVPVPPAPFGSMNRQVAAPQEEPVTTAFASGNFTSSVLLQTATVWACGNADRVLVRLLFDTGSQRTFVRNDLANKLELPSTGVEDLTVFTFGDSQRSHWCSCRKLNVTLTGRFESKEVTLDALEVPEVCTVRSSPMEPALVSILRSRNLVIADEPQDDKDQSPTISVLVGSDNYWKLVTGRIERLTDSMCAVETVFGWVIQGTYSAKDLPWSPHKADSSVLFLACSHGWSPTGDQIDPSEMWRLDSIGITDSSVNNGAHVDAALSQFMSAVHKEEGRYVIPLMIKSPECMTCTNRDVAQTLSA